MDLPTEPPEIPFQSVLKALLDVETTFPPRYLYRFSDLNPNDLESLKNIWPDIPAWRRQALLEDLEQLGEDDTLLSFSALGIFALTDAEPKIRLPAVRLLWDDDDPQLIQQFIKISSQDPDVEVRAAAAGALGAFIYQGEIEEISPARLKLVEDHLLKIVNGQDAPLVRRNALEALGFSSREEVPALIEDAYQTGQKDWIASALFAMGRSTDLIWKPYVMKMLTSLVPLLRAEAARAAGELELSDAVPQLLEYLSDPDDETRLASIWSLSQLGGEGVREALETLFDESDDEDDRDFIESALDNLNFNEDMQLLPIFELPGAPSTHLKGIYEESSGGRMNDFDEEFADDDEDEDGDFEDIFDDELDWLEEDDEEDDEDTET
jgi:hypothetical protein